MPLLYVLVMHLCLSVSGPKHVLTQVEEQASPGLNNELFKMFKRFKLLACIWFYQASISPSLNIYSLNTFLKWCGKSLGQGTFWKGF